MIGPELATPGASRLGALDDPDGRRRMGHRGRNERPDALEVDGLPGQGEGLLGLASAAADVVEMRCDMKTESMSAGETPSNSMLRSRGEGWSFSHVVADVEEHGLLAGADQVRDAWLGRRAINRRVVLDERQDRQMVDRAKFGDRRRAGRLPQTVGLPLLAAESGTWPRAGKARERPVDRVPLLGERHRPLSLRGASTGRPVV